MRMLFVPGEIAARDHCFDRIEPLVKHPANPVLVAEHFWEGSGVHYPCVLYSEHDKLFKMWYFTMVPGSRKHAPLRPLIDNAELDGQSFICYAHSTDGLHWEKPALGRVSIKGSSANNIVLFDSGFFLGCHTIIEDLTDPDPDRRYKMLVYDNDGQWQDGARTAVSPDGIDWRFVGNFPVLPTQDTPSLWHDRQRGQYVAFLKARLDGRRARMVSFSKDFATWSTPTVLLAPDSADSPTLHFYAQTAFNHCGHDFCFLNRYELSTQKMDIELIAGSEGANWLRLPSRPQVLAPGDADDWDSGIILNGMAAPVERGNASWFYYAGAVKRHDELDGPTAIGVASFTNGRLVGQQFEGDGWFQSIPFHCTGGRLSLDANSKQPLTVEVHGASYLGVIAGYTRAECKPVQGDSQSHAICWNGRETLDELQGQYITLRVYGKNATVYGASLT